MIEIGRLCVKTAGRDAGKRCVIIDIIDGQHVMIDGQTRRRKCNVAHLEPTAKVLKVKKDASNKEVCDVLKKEGIECSEKTEKPKKVQAEKAPAKSEKAKPTKKKAAKKTE